MNPTLKLVPNATVYNTLATLYVASFHWNHRFNEQVYCAVLGAFLLDSSCILCLQAVYAIGNAFVLITGLIALCNSIPSYCCCLTYEKVKRSGKRTEQSNLSVTVFTKYDFIFNTSLYLSIVKTTTVRKLKKLTIEKVPNGQITAKPWIHQHERQCRTKMKFQSEGLFS